MKNNFLQYNQKIRMGFLILLLAGIVSCKKNSITSENFQAANITVVNAWNNEDMPELKFSLDTSKTLHNGTMFYGRQLDYLVVYAGNRTAKFKKDDDGSTVIEKAVNLESKKIYSLFLTGTKASPDAVIVEDDVATEPAVGKYRIRTANMVTDAGSNYELWVAKQGQPLSSAQKLVDATASKAVSAFKDYSSDPDPVQRYQVWAIAPGVDTVTVSSVLLTSQKAYTFTVSGGKNSGILQTSLSTFTNVLPFR